MHTRLTCVCCEVSSYPLPFGPPHNSASLTWVCVVYRCREGELSKWASERTGVLVSYIQWLSVYVLTCLDSIRRPQTSVVNSPRRSPPVVTHPSSRAGHCLWRSTTRTLQCLSCTVIVKAHRDPLPFAFCRPSPDGSNLFPPRTVPLPPGPPSMHSSSSPLQLPCASIELPLFVSAVVVCPSSHWQDVGVFSWVRPDGAGLRVVDGVHHLGGFHPDLLKRRKGMMIRKKTEPFRRPKTPRTFVKTRFSLKRSLKTRFP